ncbi:MAG: hypothetical protein ACYCSR_04715 [Thiomonas sp.]
MPLPSRPERSCTRQSRLGQRIDEAESTPAAPGHHSRRGPGIALHAPGTAPEKLIVPLHLTSTAATYAPIGLRVNAVAPGMADSR